MSVQNLERTKSFSLYFLGEHVLLLAAMVVKPSRFRWIFWLPIAAIVFHLFHSNPTADPALNGAIRVHVLTSFFIASDYILLTDVQNELRRTGQKQSISSAPFWTRVKWALSLYFGSRGVGWEHEPKSVLPPRPRATRGRFLVSQFVWLVVYVLQTDVVQFAIRHTHAFTKDASPTLQRRFLRQFLHLLGSIFFMQIIHVTSCIMAMALGTSQPSGWPPIMGRWGDAYTIRKFWGRTWHQLLRRIFSSHGKYLARKLNLRTGSNVSSYVQLYTAFLISGTIHITPTDIRPLYFFVSQAVAITFEDAVIAVAGRVGYKTPTKIYKLIGYAWVWCWFIYSIPPWMESMIDGGMLKSDPGPTMLDAMLIRTGLNRHIHGL